MSQTDSNIVKPFLWVLGALVVFTFLIAIIANIYSPKSDSAADPLVQQGMKKQIAPVGRSRVETAAEVAAPKAEIKAQDDQVKTVEAEPAADSTATVAVAATAAAAVTAAGAGATEENTDTDTEAQETAMVAAGPSSESADIPLRVRAVVATNCAGCHQEGIRGAQRSDDVAAWTALSEKGIEELTQSVINGKGAMSPRAETSLTDEEIELAVRHMIAQSTGSETTGGAEETVTDESAAAPAAPAAEVAEAASTSTAEAAASTAVAQAEPISANVKGVVDTLCASCHISGVADAPKYGDKAAWDQRMAAGIDKVLAAAIAGKGVMPPRGGSQLSDAELRQAIEYMASK